MAATTGGGQNSTPAPSAPGSSAAAKAGALIPTSDWGKFALGYGALWVILIGMVDAGAGQLAAGLALLIAGSAAVLYAPRALTNLGFGGK